MRLMPFDRLQLPAPQAFTKKEHEQSAANQTQGVNHDDRLRPEQFGGVTDEEGGQRL
jgi:hypothetical protein